MIEAPRASPGPAAEGSWLLPRPGQISHPPYPVHGLGRGLLGLLLAGLLLHVLHEPQGAVI